MSTSPTPPTALVVRKGNDLTVLRCPYCGRKHHHGAGTLPGPDYGHRWEHCTTGVHQAGYFLKEATS